MRIRTTFASVIVATLTACGSGSTSPDPANAKSATSQAPSISAEDLAKAREAAGLPPEPDAKARGAYLDALNAIDARIIKPGKEDQAVSRGMNQCRTVKDSPDDTQKLAEAALDRFTVNSRLPEIAIPATGEKITAAVRKHLCPDF
ncbi:hypothetical protein [Streptomyces chilikensis]|uniref:hypothetical protein n=1 Tax=Streptomyces chilikensis TaxID=1194079 RepID=UPI000A7AB983|nr:hypothetical protein [Streptomyces chilikensis]